MDNKSIVVVGGGPAGMMAAIRAGQLGSSVVLVEKKSSLGNKLLLSGKGRCNLTNASELDPFLERFSAHGEFLRDAFKKFFNDDLMRFFEEAGLKLETERQLRVFPATDRSAGVVMVLKKELQKSKVQMEFNTPIKEIITVDGKVTGLLSSEGKRISANRVILATGGLSYTFTGSTGEGLEMARALGHRIVACRPGLVPLKTQGVFAAALEGLTLKNIRLTFSDGKRSIVSEIGELLFTSFGISGPLVLTLSGKVVDLLQEGKSVSVKIDLKPALSPQQLDARLLRDFKANARKSIKNILKALLPARLIGVFISLMKIDPNINSSQITVTQRTQLVSLCKAFCLEITGPRPIEEAMVTRGGVSLKEINPRTMESRLVKGLYFAGEMIDVDADTGGFNLQAAFSTGYLAGESAALT